jgi:hypothetical protein
MTDTEYKVLLKQLLELLPEKTRPDFQKRIEETLNKQMKGDDQDHDRALRYLKDLDIFVHMRGPDFMYSRGIAETLRVGEDIFELAYAMKHAATAEDR